MPRTTLSALLAAALAFGASTAVQAQDQETGEVELDRPVRRATRVEPAARRYNLSEPGPLRVYGGFSIAVGGELQQEGGGGADLDATVGLQGGAEYVVMDYFSIGGETRLLFPKTDGAAGRDFLWDLVVKPKGRYAFPNLPLEVYGSLPLGLTVPGIDGPAEGTVGFNIGLLGGATWWFNEHIGVNAELGWTFHKFGYKYTSEYEFEDEEFESSSDKVDVKMNQFLLLCPNFVYAL